MPKFVAIVALPSELPIEIWNRNEPLIYSGVGKLNAAIATLESINKYQPEFILNLGTVGSIRNDISGVVEIKKVFQRDFDATPLVPKSFVPFDEKPQVLSADFGQYNCGSGDTFVREKEEWLMNNSIDVVDMELFGVAFACYSKNIPWRSFKFITDYVSINSGDDWRKNLEKSGSALINAIELINS
jgi:adenosylhomocysteine nucleosidase